jgi:YD repeat-containing protein
MDGSLTRYGYDFLNRLVREQRVGSVPYDFQWGYDGDGNRLVQDRSGALTKYAYDDDGLLLQAQTAASPPDLYQWDAAGRLAYRSRAGMPYRFAYDAEGRLISIQEWDGLLWQPSRAYQYDGLDRRVVRQTDARTATFAHDGFSVLREDATDRLGNQQCLEFTWGGGLIRSLDTASGMSAWSGTDGSGALRAWTDDHGGASAYAAIYTTFGQVIAENDSAGRPPYAFGADAGFRTEDDAGLIFTGFGWQDPVPDQALDELEQRWRRNVIRRIGGQKLPSSTPPQDDPRAGPDCPPGCDHPGEWRQPLDGPPYFRHAPYFPPGYRPLWDPVGRQDRPFSGYSMEDHMREGQRQAADMARAGVCGTGIMDFLRWWRARYHQIWGQHYKDNWRPNQGFGR